MKIYCRVFFMHLYYSLTLEHYIRHVGIDLELQKHHLHSKFSKCQFVQSQLEYLGHIFSKEGVAADASRISSMVGWPTC